MSEFHHVSVLLQECIDGINIRTDERFIKEDGWADPDTEPTHMIILFLTSCGEAFYGGVGNTLWIDNVEVVM